MFHMGVIMNSYNIIENLYYSQEDFIVLGLCGKTGSGCSTVAKILESNFEDLRLSTPNDINNSIYKTHEYNILYNFAKMNWRRFYRIKTSALITATVLEYDEKQLVDFLENISNDLLERESLEEICSEFYSAKMYFNLSDWFKIDPNDQENCKQYFSREAKKEYTVNFDISIEKECEVSECFEFEAVENSEKIKCYNVGTEFWIDNRNLYKLFLQYKNSREKKDSFKNPMFFWILKKYIYDFLPDVVSKFWSELKIKSEALPTLAMQLFGINLRISKKPYYDKTEDYSFVKDGYVTTAEYINVAIKLLRSYKLKWYSYIAKEGQFRELKNRPDLHEHTLVVIDSIKNPFESMYLKQRYSNYYLLGVYTEDSERISRLEEKNLTQKEIRLIDKIELLSEFKKEYKKIVEDKKTLEDENEGIAGILYKLIKQVEEMQLKDILSFVFQNVASCLDSADIFINNSKDNKALLKLKNTLIRYVSLAMHPGLVLPTQLERCMQIAYTAKVNSGCISRQVGAVITDKEYNLLSVGWNQQPSDQLPCSYRNLNDLCNHWTPEVYSDYENDDDEKFLMEISKKVNIYYGCDSNLSKNGKLPYYCFKDLYNKITNKENQVHPRSLHAEETAFLNLGPTGKMLVKGGCLFTTSSPCELCAKKAKYMGISKIYYVEPYSGISYKHVLSAGGEKSRPDFILLTGAIGRAYMQLYTPLLPLKDEHELWMGDKTEKILLE